LWRLRHNTAFTKHSHWANAIMMIALEAAVDVFLQAFAPLKCGRFS
jgi:hypothetical protein